LKVVRAQVRDADRQSDCFVFVCEKLSDDGFRRLLKFDVAGRARFSTWLTVVATNLVIDWVRNQRGRERAFTNVAKLPALEQRLFRHRFERALPLRDCFSLLLTEFPDLDVARFDAALATLERTLNSTQRWRLSIRGRRNVPLDDADLEPSGEPGLEDGAARNEELVHLAGAMARLSERERLLLALRFEQELTFDQIARLLKLGDAFRARREVEAALRRLTELFPPK
jgi:RNA polymerase sigma factor (sigma-70 family)